LLDAGIDVRFTRRHEGVKMIALDASPDFHPSPQPTEPNQLRPPAPAPVPAGRLSPGLVLPPSGATLDR
jgi:hypothetical protein